MSSASSIRSAAKAQALGGREKELKESPPRHAHLPNLALSSWRVRQVLRLEHVNLASNLRLWHMNRFPGTASSMRMAGSEQSWFCSPFSLACRACRAVAPSTCMAEPLVKSSTKYTQHFSERLSPGGVSGAGSRRTESAFAESFAQIWECGHTDVPRHNRRMVFLQPAIKKTKLHHLARRSGHSGNAPESLGELSRTCAPVGIVSGAVRGWHDRAAPASDTGLQSGGAFKVLFAEVCQAPLHLPARSCARRHRSTEPA